MESRETTEGRYGPSQNTSISTETNKSNSSIYGRGLQWRRGKRTGFNDTRLPHFQRYSGRPGFNGEARYGELTDPPNFKLSITGALLSPVQALESCRTLAFDSIMYFVYSNNPQVNKEYVRVLEERHKKRANVNDGILTEMNEEQLFQSLQRGKLEFWLHSMKSGEEDQFMDSELLMCAWKLQHWIWSIAEKGKLRELAKFLVLHKASLTIERTQEKNWTHEAKSMPHDPKQCLAQVVSGKVFPKNTSGSGELPAVNTGLSMLTTDPRPFFYDSSFLFTTSERSCGNTSSSNFVGRLLPGAFIRATGPIVKESEAVRPMEDLALLKLRFQSSQCHNMINSKPLRGSEIRAIFQGSSILNRRFYYPIRRFTKMQPYTPYSYAETVAWEEAVWIFYKHFFPEKNIPETVSENVKSGVKKYSKQHHSTSSFFFLPYMSPETVTGLQKTFHSPQSAVLPPDPQSRTAFASDTLSIFISIASYRDVECGSTVLDAFTKSKNPFRVYVGIAEQAVPSESPEATQHDARCVVNRLYNPLLVFHPFPRDEEEATSEGEGWFRRRPPLMTCPNLTGTAEGDEDFLTRQLPKHMQKTVPFKSCWRPESTRRWDALEERRDRRRTAFNGAIPPASTPLDTSPPSKVSRTDARSFTRQSNLTPMDKDLYTNYVRGLMIPEENIRRRRINAHHARGPTYGRFMAMLLYQGEDFLLVIDSHHRFVPHWDVMAIYWFKAFKDPRAVMSHYPEAFVESESKNFELERSSSAYLCQATFLEDQSYIRLSAIIVNELRTFQKNNKYNLLYSPSENEQWSVEDDAFYNLIPRPSQSAVVTATEPPLLRGVFKLPQPWIAGGFLFARGVLMREVPFDPHLPMLFDGEEVLFGVRLWTHGYNLYSPPRNLAYHLYGREKAPRLWGDESKAWHSVQPKSQDRVRYMLQSRFKGEVVDGPVVGVPTAEELKKAAENSRKRVPGALMAPEEVIFDTRHTTSNERDELNYFLWAHRTFTRQLLNESTDFSNSERTRTEDERGGALNVYVPPSPHLHSNHFHDLPDHIKLDLLRFGMGKKRSVSQWYDYAGVDSVKHLVDKRWCG